MESHIYKNLRRFISVVDELRDVGLQQYVNLPRICVVGTQSAGKSSVLESIVGLNFLPRGDGVVTRRPLELRLVHVAESDARGSSPWAVFDLGEGKQAKFTDFESVKVNIEKLTDDVAGRNKGIVDDPIVLTVYGNHCPDLTLIDLPGITRVPLKGTDQNDDVERLTREMAMRYAKDPRTIILAVIPANVDISTADALHIARKTDPRSVRTIGVITKIDLMDRGTDAAKMLLGEEIPLRLGYTGVKNRGQADIKHGKSVHDAMEEEKSFFSSHPVYRTLPPEVLGTQSLVEKLTKVLFRHIKSYLPDIKREISVKTRTVGSRLEELGDGVPLEDSDKVQLMWTMITDYCEIFKNTIRGKYDKRLQNYFDAGDSRGILSEGTGGAQIRSIFYELLEDFIDKAATDEMTDHDIDMAIRIHEGDSLPGFPSTDTFEYLILPHLHKVQQPIMDCLDNVSASLEFLSQRIAQRVFGRFPRLAEQVLELSNTILNREKDHTKQVLENIVTSETGYLFTNDVAYLTNHGAMIPMTEKEKPHNMMDQNSVPGLEGPPGQHPSVGVRDVKASEKAGQLIGSVHQTMSNLWTARESEQTRTRYSGPFIQEIRSRLDKYFSIVLRNVRDAVPKAIGTFLVRQIQDKLQFELYNELNKAEQLSELLGEPPHILEERRGLAAQLATLKKAMQVLQRDPDIGGLSNVGFADEIPMENDLQQGSSAGRGSSPSVNQQQTGGAVGGIFDSDPRMSGLTGTRPRVSPDGNDRTSVLFGGTGSANKYDIMQRKTPLFGDKPPASTTNKSLFEAKEASSTKRPMATNPLFPL